MWIRVGCDLFCFAARLPRARSGFVLPFSRFGFGFGRPLYAALSFVRVVGSLLALVSPFAFGGVFGRFALAVLLLNVARDAAPRVDRPFRKLAKKSDVRFVRFPYLNRPSRT